MKRGFIALGLGLALFCSGCPGGADLENSSRFRQYGVTNAGTGSGGASAGVGGTAAGSAGTAGSVTFSCDVEQALTSAGGMGNCAISGCHNSFTHFAGLDLSDFSTIADKLVDVPATHGDIDCSAPTETYRPCTATEIAQKCPPNALLIDSQHFDDSWVVKKLTPGGAMGCGDDMPLRPGNDPQHGWSEDKRQCLLAFFRSLVPATP